MHISQCLCDCTHSVNIFTTFRTTITLRSILSHSDPSFHTQIHPFPPKVSYSQPREIRSYVLHSYHAKTVVTTTLGRQVYVCQLGLNSTKMLSAREKRRSRLQRNMFGQHNILINWDNISVVDQDKDSIPRKIREALHIRRHGGRLINRDSGLEISCVWDRLLQ